MLFPTPKTRLVELIRLPVKFTASLTEPAIPKTRLRISNRAVCLSITLTRSDGDDRPAGLCERYGTPRAYEELAERGVDAERQRSSDRARAMGGSWRGIDKGARRAWRGWLSRIYSDPRNDGYYQGRCFIPKAPGATRTARSAVRLGTCRSSRRSADARGRRDRRCKRLGPGKECAHADEDSRACLSLTATRVATFVARHCRATRAGRMARRLP